MTTYTAFSWTMEHPNDSGDWARIILIDRIAVSIAPSEQPAWIRSWTRSNAEEALESALYRTEYWENLGHVLHIPPSAAQVEVDITELMMECVSAKNVGPILDNLLGILNRNGLPL